MAPKKYTERKREEMDSAGGEITGVVLILVSAFFLLCLSLGKYVLGDIGVAISNVLKGVFGYFVFPLTVITLILGIMKVAHRSVTAKPRYIVGTIVTVFAVVTIAHIAASRGQIGGTFGEYETWLYHNASVGGALLGVIAYCLVHIFTEAFTYILLALAAIVAVCAMAGLFDGLPFVKRRAVRKKKEAKKTGYAKNYAPAESAFTPTSGGLFVGEIYRRDDGRSDSGRFDDLGESDAPQEEPPQSYEENSTQRARRILFGGSPEAYRPYDDFLPGKATSEPDIKYEPPAAPAAPTATVPDVPVPPAKEFEHNFVAGEIINGEELSAKINEEREKKNREHTVAYGDSPAEPAQPVNAVPVQPMPAEPQPVQPAPTNQQPIVNGDMYRSPAAPAASARPAQPTAPAEEKKEDKRTEEYRGYTAPDGYRPYFNPGPIINGDYFEEGKQPPLVNLHFAQPVQPAQPQPAAPVRPVQPTQPQPAVPVQPVQPAQPQPAVPVQPVQPAQPQPAVPVQPVQPAQPTEPVGESGETDYGEEAAMPAPENVYRAPGFTAEEEPAAEFEEEHAEPDEEVTESYEPEFDEESDVPDEEESYEDTPDEEEYDAQGDDGEDFGEEDDEDGSVYGALTGGSDGDDIAGEVKGYDDFAEDGSFDEPVEFEVETSEEGETPYEEGEPQETYDESGCDDESEEDTAPTDEDDAPSDEEETYGEEDTALSKSFEENTTSFVISDEVEDLSERSFSNPNDTTGYYNQISSPAPTRPVPPDDFNRRVGELDGKINRPAQPVAPAAAEAKPEKPKPKKPTKYHAPPLELLVTESTHPAPNDNNMNTKIFDLEHALEELNVPATVTGVTVGPAVTRYELDMPPGMSVKKIENLASDIRYNLASKGQIRIEAPIPGKRAVGVEVPNDEIYTVALKDIIGSKEFAQSSSPLTIALGKDIQGRVMITRLEKMPHLLIAGTTGSGKSSCLNSLLVSLLYKASPSDVRIILVDPKQVEFTAYNGIPHMMIPNAITDITQAINAFKWAFNEMEARYTRLRDNQVRDIQEYNQSPEVKEGRLEKMPYIVLIVDEFANLITSSPANRKILEDLIMAIASKARAAGIHLVLATQRPSVDVITGTIKANLPSRIAFAVANAQNSRIILDTQGAEALLGRGDMLFCPLGDSDATRIQGAFVENSEVKSIVNFVKENNPSDFDSDFEAAIMPKEPEEEEDKDDEEEDSRYDKEFADVVRCVIRSGKATTSMIQRRFRFGFNRAARIIEQMEELHFIAPQNGTNPREIYVTKEKFEEFFGEPFEQ